MYNFSEKQKIILSLFVASGLIGLSLSFPFLKTNFEIVLVKTEKVIEKFKNSLPVFAQYFFPRYPQRLTYLALELSQAGDELISLTERLDRNIAQCSCQLAQSQCLSGPSTQQVEDQINKEFSSGLSPEIARKIDEAVLSINEKITESISEAENEMTEAFNEIQEELNKTKEQGTSTSKKTEDKLRFIPVVQSETDIVSELEQTLNTMKNQTIDELKNEGAEVKENIEEYKTTFKNELNKLQTYPQTEIVSRFQVLYQKFLSDTENELMKLDPNKIIRKLENELENIYAQIRDLPTKLLSDIERSLQTALTDLKRDLVSALDLQDIFAFLKNPLGFLFQGGCMPGPIGAFGEPCPNRDAIEKNQIEVKEKTEQISFLRNLLIKEMETGLERELETLDKEIAEELRTNFNEILQQSQDISSLSIENSKLPSDCVAENCSVACGSGTAFKAKACVESIRGEQKPITLKFNVQVGLEDLELGKVSISAVNLKLPEEINISPLGDLTIAVPPQEIVVSFPPQETLPDLSQQTYTVHQAETLLPKAPKLTLPCPKFTESSYQCEAEFQQEEITHSGMSQYSEELARRSEACQNLAPDPNSDCYQSIKRQIENDPRWIKAIEECKNAVKCALTDTKCIADCMSRIKECEKECEGIPDCSCNQEDWLRGCKEGCNVEDLIKKRNEQIENEAKRICKRPECFNPQALGVNLPSAFNYSVPQKNCPSQIIHSFPSSMLGCEASPPTIPSIKLPSIKIPDIKLGELKLLPFLYIKFPSFVFEDLIFPQINLCNIDDCKNFFPHLDFQLPILSIPEIDAIEAQAPELGAPKVRIETFPIPPIPFTLPQLPNLLLSSLMLPELDIEVISLPDPRISVGLEGIDADIAWALASFLLNRLGLPVPEFYACVEGFFQTGLPVSIVFPNYYFAWPAFPDIPQIPFCKDINDFCGKIKTKLKVVTDKVPLIQNKVNQAFQKEIQQKLDKAAAEINKEISEEIKKYLEKVSQQIKREVEEKIKSAQVKDGKIYIPPAFIKVEGLKKTYNLNNKIKIPQKIVIPWPEELKKVPLQRDPIQYNLPTIPLSDFSFSKTFSLKGPGFQSLSINVDFQYGAECVSLPPSGDPCPGIDVQKIKDIQQEINETSKTISNILE